jgi:hypothetical protein
MLMQLHRLLGNVNQQLHTIQINFLIKFVGLRYIIIVMHGTKNTLHRLCSKNLKRGDCGSFQGTIPKFEWRNCEKPR